MRTSSLHFQPPTATTLTVEAVRGVGVKQSGGRLFQLNNLKRKIVDELFLDWSSYFPLPQCFVMVVPLCDSINAPKFSNEVITALEFGL